MSYEIRNCHLFTSYRKKSKLLGLSGSYLEITGLTHTQNGYWQISSSKYVQDDKISVTGPHCSAKPLPHAPIFQIILILELALIAKHAG